MFEQKTFKLLESDSASCYDLLNALNYNEALYKQGKKQIEGHITDLKAKNLHQKTLKKQIQTIYKSTHDKFFKKYEAKAFFNDIFQNGNYNCVTASALYAIILDEFNINYAIKETPTHVYIIADTSGLQTLIESTLPGTGAVSFNEKFKKDYIAYLHTNKIISNTEFQNNSTDELFRQFYSQHQSISLADLTALQYYNKGIFLIEEEKYTGAASYLSKAYTIYPSNNISFNHYAALQNALLKDFTNKTYDGNLYGQVFNSSVDDSTLYQIALNYFENVSAELCIKSPDIERYEKFIQAISSYSSSSHIPKEVQHKSYYFSAYYYGATGNYPRALSYIKTAYNLDKDNLLVKDIAEEIGVKYMFLDSRPKQRIDTLNHYFNEIPFLLENKLFQQHYVYYYARIISESIMYDDSKTGLQYYERFLDALDKYGINNYSEEHIGIIFGVMTYYYTDNRNFAKAYSVVNKGLELAPESLRLREAKRDITDAKSYAVYSSNAQYKDIVYVDNNVNTPESLKEKVEKYFPGKWKAVAIEMEDMEQKLTKKEVFEFIADKNKDCTYTHNGKVEKGKWAYRYKSKCIYFVPSYNKDKYKVFKVKEVSADKIVLLPYKDQKTPSPYKYVLKPFN